jgi:SAM-dependent methyltransferase
VSAETLGERYARLAGSVSGVARVGWLDRLQQEVQFEVLLELAIGPTASVFDAGCGTGDLLAVLNRTGFRGRYTGFDLLPAFVGEAEARFAGRAETHFSGGDLLTEPLPPHDFVLASGLFDYYTGADEANWAALVPRLFEAAQLAMAWNGYYQLPPGRADMWAIALSRVVELCERLSPFWRLRADYAPGHYTAFLYRRAYWLTPALQLLIGRLFLDRSLLADLRNEPYQFAEHYQLSLRQLNLLSSLAEAESAGS